MLEPTQGENRMKLMNDLKMATFTTALVGVGLFTAASANAEGSAQKFITDAMQGNLAEVNIGKLAQENSSNPRVKAFGATLRQDHSDAYRAAGVAASSVGVDVPTEPSKSQQELYNKLATLRGEEFDKEFTKNTIKDHKADISMYAKEAKQNDGQVSSYAAKTLPTLQKHLRMAEDLAR
jgi:putative membrane protein